MQTFTKEQGIFEVSRAIENGEQVIYQAQEGQPSYIIFADGDKWCAKSIADGRIEGFSNLYALEEYVNFEFEEAGGIE